MKCQLPWLLSKYLYWHQFIKIIGYTLVLICISLKPGLGTLLKKTVWSKELCQNLAICRFIHIRSSDYSKLLIGVKGGLSLCYPCNRIVENHSKVHLFLSLTQNQLALAPAFSWNLIDKWINKGIKSISKYTNVLHLDL